MKSRQRESNIQQTGIDIDKIIKILSITLIPLSLYTFTVLGIYDRTLELFYFGWHLAAYDPFIRYYLAKFLVDAGIGNGLLWWMSGGLAKYVPSSVLASFSIKIVNGHTIFTKFWYPWGINWAKVLSPGVSLLGALAYELFGRGLGLTLLETVVALPCFINALSVLSVAYLTWRICPQEIRKWCAIIAALWVSTTALYTIRSYAGWFDDVAMYQFFAPLGMALFLEAYLRRGWQRPLFIALSALVNGFTVWLWGGYFYLFNIYGLAAIFASLYALYRDPEKIDPGRLFSAYLVTYLGFITFILLTPRYGLSVVFGGKGFLPLIGVLFTAFVYISYRFFSEKIVTIRRVFKYIFIIGTIIILACFIAASVGILKIKAIKLSGRYLAILAPPLRKALVSSVAEHQYVPANSIMTMFSLGVVLAAISLIMFFIEPSLISILMIVGVLFGMYFLASMYYTAFSICMIIIPAAIYSLTLPLRLGFTYTSLALLIIFGIVLAISMAYTAVVPLTIPTLEQGYWLPALEWLQFKTKPNATVVSWWDYGYLISVVANRTSLADNSTVNGTQIATIAKLFLAEIYDKNEVLKLLKELGKPEYMLVYQPFTVLTVASRAGYECIGIPQVGGDFDKSIWMARIAGYPDNFTFTHFICRFTKIKRIVGPYITYQIQLNRYIINGRESPPMSVPCSINYTIYYAMFNPGVLVASYQCPVLLGISRWIFELSTPVTGYAFMMGTLVPVRISYVGHVVKVGEPVDWLSLAYPPIDSVYIYRIDYSVFKKLK